MYKKILIANRGEVALRIIRTCKKLNIKTVAIFSKIDKKSMHVYQANEAICVEKNNDVKNSYLNIKNIIKIAKITNSKAIHPGYGFLSENANFAKEVKKNNIDFIGPNLNSLEQMSNKIKAKNIAKKYGFYTLPMYKCTSDEKKNIILARKISYPLILKTIVGGGGKGIRIVENEKDLNNNILLTKQEAKISYNTSSIYMEKFLKNVKHIEIQTISDNKDTIILGARDCSTQEHQQKIIEETPININSKTHLKNIKNQCKKFCNAIKYTNIGTIEFLYDNEKFYFIEMNPRLQVEHTITENITNIDLVEKQIKISYFKKLDIKQNDVIFSGHSIQCRINIKNQSENKIKFLHIPGGHGIRFDSHIYNGYKIPTQYDKLIGKLITHGLTRSEAKRKMLSSLNEIIIYNIKTNIPLLKRILIHPHFKKNRITTEFLKKLKKKFIK